MSAIEGHNFTAAECLSIDRHSNEKHEFAFGEIRVMTGARVNHVVIVGNIASELSNQLRRRPHHVFMSALRMCVSPDRCYTYPDVVVVCDKPQLMDDQFDTLLNPNLIVEVLSESTRNYDRGDKFQQYRGISSFREYLLVDQERVHVERYSKQSGGTWSLWETDSLADIVRLESLGLALPVSEIYFKIDL